MHSEKEALSNWAKPGERAKKGRPRHIVYDFLSACLPVATCLYVHYRGSCYETNRSPLVLATYIL